MKNNKVTQTQLKNKILQEINQLVLNFLYYDRKKDKKLTRNCLLSAIKNKQITLHDIITRFESELSNAFDIQDASTCNEQPAFLILTDTDLESFKRYRTQKAAIAEAKQATISNQMYSKYYILKTIVAFKSIFKLKTIKLGHEK